MSEFTLSAAQIGAEKLSDWRFVDGQLRVRFDTADFATGLRLVNQIGDAAEAANHHPDIDLRYAYVEIALSSHDAHGITNRDIDLARKISAFASGLGVAAVDLPAG